MYSICENFYLSHKASWLFVLRNRKFIFLLLEAWHVVINIIDFDAQFGAPLPPRNSEIGGENFEHDRSKFQLFGVDRFFGKNCTRVRVDTEIWGWLG